MNVLKTHIVADVDCLAEKADGHDEQHITDQAPPTSVTWQQVNI